MDQSMANIDTVAKTCIAVRLRVLNRVVTGLYDDALRPLGLKVSQLNILIVAAKLGLARPAQVCKLLHLDVSTLSRNAERMRTQGWLEFVPGQDARTHSFRLTSQGERLIEKAIPAWEKAQSDAKKLIGGEGVAVLDRLAGELTGGRSKR